jgi:aminocarboxymuconate-semialdehyde decarboxylase
MTTYDMHAHVMSVAALDAMAAEYPDHAPRLVERGSDQFLEFPGRAAMGPLHPGMFDVAVRLADMDRQRVDIQLLSVPPSNFFYHLPIEVGAAFARASNDAMAETVAASPDRFQMFATLPLQDEAAALKELGRVASDPHVRGIEIGTNIDGADLDVDELAYLWPALVEFDMPAWLHPDQRTIAGADRLTRYYLQNLIGNPLETTIAIAALIFGGVMERHPNLRVGLVHGGGFAPYQIGRWRHGWEVRPEARVQLRDTSPEEMLRRFTFDSLTHDGVSLRDLGERFDWTNVVLGSDYPFDMGPADLVGELVSLDLGDDVETAVRQLNAERFLRTRDASGL